jgi:uncharacterized membrane protein YqjE
VGTKRREDQQFTGVTDLVARLVEGLGQLLTQHVALARMELGEEARSVSRALGTLALFAVFLLLGYAMLCFGVALALGPWLTLPGAVAAVGALNLVAGAVGLWSVRKILERPILENTLAAAQESAQLLATEAHREASGVH